MEPQILFKDAYVKNGNIYVPALIAEGDYTNENGICYASSLLEKWHKENAILGIAHNAHPTGNHPLAYEDTPPDDLAESAQVDYYRKKSHDWGFGTYVKSILKTLETGSKRLIGIFKITDDGAKKAWNEKKFPPFVSSSAFVHQQKDGVITDASLVGVSSVNKPAYPEHIAGVSKQCTGGDECITQLAESSNKRDHYCLYCRHTILSKISSHSVRKVSESSMANDNDSSGQKTPGSEVETEIPIKDMGQTETDSKGNTKETEGSEQELDYKKLFEDATKEISTLKKSLKTANEANDTNTKDIAKLKEKSLKSAISEKLAKVPLFAFDNKEENKDEVVKEFLGLQSKLEEKEILDLVDKRYMLAPKIVEITKRSKLGESGMITDEGKLINHETNEDSNDTDDLLSATEVFGK